VPSANRSGTTGAISTSFCLSPVPAVGLLQPGRTIKRANQILAVGGGWRLSCCTLLASAI
ncbi:MAG TPA: hypothetical protein VF177_20555, partial [Anaerolineae bacterium]